MEYLLSFSSTHKALKAESLLKDGDLSFRLLPAPKEITVSCALVISVEAKALEETLVLLGERGAKPERVYKREDDKYAQV